MTCPLCLQSESKIISGESIKDRYFRCLVCDLRYLDPHYHLSTEDEKEQYLLHDNDVTDPRYQDFVRPLFNIVRERMSSTARGLDFGCGAGPVLSRMLHEASYQIVQYDPFFSPDRNVLNARYDYICSSEVVEHFFTPHKEFEQLRDLLNVPGLLAIMTLLYEPECDFEHWFYRRDPTHTVFYSRRTFQWIAQNWKFNRLEFLSGRLILLTTG